MIPDTYCSNCGSLLRTTYGICPKCGERNESIHQAKVKSFLINEKFLIYVFIGSILLPLCSPILFGIFFKFIPVNNYGFNSFLYQMSYLALNIAFIYFLITHYYFDPKKTKNDFKLFLLGIFLVSGVGNGIALVFNNFLLSPLMNSLGNQNTSILSYNLNYFINFFAINIIIGAISFTLQVIFILDFNKKEILSSNLSAVNTVLIVVSGLFMGIIIESLNSSLEIILIRSFQYNIVLFNFLFGSLSDLIDILVPLVFAVILIIIRKKSFLKTNIVYFSIFFASVFIGQISFIQFFYPGDFSHNLILIELISIIFGFSFGITVNFFALNFLVKFIISHSPSELLNEQYTHSKANFTFSNLFKNRNVTEHPKINIDPSLEKIESILKENTEN